MYTQSRAPHAPGVMPRRETAEERSKRLNDEMTGALKWTIAAPILFSWAMASFLPLFGFLRKDTTAVAMGIDFLFLATSFLPVMGVYFFCYFVAGNAEQRGQVVDFPRGAALGLSVWAFFWIVGYTLAKAMS